MIQTRNRGSGKTWNDESSDDDDDDNESPSSGSGKLADSKFMMGGLLPKRPEFTSPKAVGNVELDNLVAREVNEWKNENPLRVLRQRRNISEHAMDEVILYLS